MKFSTKFINSPYAKNARQRGWPRASVHRDYSLDCHRLFHTRYMLPCKHIFHEHIYGTTRLLTANAWRTFQEVFEESGFEVYEGRELVMADVSEQTEEEKRAENRRLAVNELTERLRHKYYGLKKEVVLGKQRLFEKLEASLNPINNDPNAF